MKNEKGFTLIETVIALLILGVVALGMLSGLGTASKALFTTDKLETGKNLAESKMEFVTSVPYYVLPTGSAYFAGATLQLDSDIGTTLFPVDSSEDFPSAGTVTIGRTPVENLGITGVSDTAHLKLAPSTAKHVAGDPIYSYEAISALPTSSGYSARIHIQNGNDPNIQVITVNIYFNGILINTLVDYKAK